MAKKIAFRNNVELENYLYKEMNLALNDTYDYLLDKLIFYIKRDVYKGATKLPESKEPFYIYNRTYDLIDKRNWKISRMVRNNKLYFKLEFVGGFLEHDLDNFVHGNNKYGEISPQDFLKVINNRQHKYWRFGNMPFVYREPFWDDFLDYCERNYDKIFQKMCANRGIKLT